MHENNEPRQVGAPTMETNIVFETQRKSIGQAIIVWLVRTVIGLTIVAGLGYAFLNFTPAGEEMKDKYERGSRRTVEVLDQGVAFCRAYASRVGHPPSSTEEIQKFQKERLLKPFGGAFSSSERGVPYWYPKDGFGHDIDIQSNPQTRKIKLTPPLGSCHFLVTSRVFST